MDEEGLAEVRERGTDCASSRVSLTGQKLVSMLAEQLVLAHKKNCAWRIVGLPRHQLYPFCGKLIIITLCSDNSPATITS